MVENCWKMSKIVKIVKNFQNCQKFSKLSKIVKMLVRSCFLITVIKCLKGHWSLVSLFNVKKQKVGQWLSDSVSDKVTYWAVRWQLKTTTGKWVLHESICIDLHWYSSIDLEQKCEQNMDFKRPRNITCCKRVFGYFQTVGQIFVAKRRCVTCNRGEYWEYRLV